MSVTTLYRDEKAAKSVETISAARILKDGDTGKVFILSAAAGAAVSLPAPKAGLNFKFITGSAFATTAWTIVCPSAIGQGGAIVNSTFVPAANETTITLSASAETVGDYLDIISDGTNYYISGVGAAASSIAFA